MSDEPVVEIVTAHQSSCNGCGWHTQFMSPKVELNRMVEVHKANCPAREPAPCNHADMSWSGVDQLVITHPAKVWRCDNCGKEGTSAELRLNG